MTYVLWEESTVTTWEALSEGFVEAVKAKVMVKERIEASVLLGSETVSEGYVPHLPSPQESSAGEEGLRQLWRPWCAHAFCLRWPEPRREDGPCAGPEEPTPERGQCSAASALGWLSPSWGKAANPRPSCRPDLSGQARPAF